MRLTQDDTVVHTLASDRSDQPFGKAILPGRSRCNGFVPNTHGAQSACNDRTVGGASSTDSASVASTVPLGSRLPFA